MVERVPCRSRPTPCTGGVRFLALTFVVGCAAVDVGPATAQSGAGFRFDLGRQELGGEWGSVLAAAVDAEIALLYAIDGFRMGVGVNWASMRVHDVDQSWQHTTGHLLLGYGPALGSRIQPFGEVRYLRRVARPEGSRMLDDEPATEPGSPFRATGSGVGARLGVEVSLRPASALSLSVDRLWFETRPDPSDFGLGRIRGGTAWRLATGLTWFPGARASTNRRMDGAAGAVDSSPGPHPGSAVGVGSLGLLLPWTWNEYVKGKRFTGVSPRSWWKGVRLGFAWDDNTFPVNYLKHPYQGQFYYNAARANGFGWATSAAATLVGSYLWECCVETHVPSFPDMVTTAVGGVALGESLHRVSSSLLDDGVRGPERMIRELVAAALNPARGISRLITGEAWAVDDASLRRPPTPTGSPSPSVPRPLGPLRVQAGARSTSGNAAGRRSLLPYLALEWRAGHQLDQDDRLFSYQRMRLGLHYGERSPFAEVDVRGSLWRSPTGTIGSGGAAHRFSVFLDADYRNTEAYRLGIQGLTGGWALGLPVADRTTILLESEVSLVVLGSVNSEFARYAEIRGVRERLREYDFGIGGGGRLSLALDRDGGTRLEVSSRLVALETLNGSNVGSSRSWHVVEIFEAEARQPIGAGVSLGVDMELYRQESSYSFPDFGDASLQRWEGRLLLSWRPPSGTPSSSP